MNYIKNPIKISDITPGNPSIPINIDVIGFMSMYIPYGFVIIFAVHRITAPKRLLKNIFKMHFPGAEKIPALISDIRRPRIYPIHKINNPVLNLSTILIYNLY